MSCLPTISSLKRSSIRPAAAYPATALQLQYWLDIIVSSVLDTVSRFGQFWEFVVNRPGCRTLLMGVFGQKSVSGLTNQEEDMTGSAFSIWIETDSHLTLGA